MAKRKSLKSIQTEKRRLETIERQVIEEMTTEVGQGMLTLYLLDPTNPLWSRDLQLLAQLQELATASRRPGNPRRKIRGDPGIKIAESPADDSGNGAVAYRDDREFGSAGKDGGIER